MLFRIFHHWTLDLANSTYCRTLVEYNHGVIWFNGRHVQIESRGKIPFFRDIDTGKNNQVVPESNGVFMLKACQEK
jgi:hypothetical protein